MTSARLQWWGDGGARWLVGAKALSAVLKATVRTRHAAPVSLPPPRWGMRNCGQGVSVVVVVCSVVKQVSHTALSCYSCPLAPINRILCSY